MNAHTPHAVFAASTLAPVVNVDEAAIAAAKIRNLAEALITVGDSIVREGDGRLGNMIAALAGAIQTEATRVEMELGFGAPG